ncbi:hypothetical protein N0V90_001011 [Kalmusia sp. IMI 367209]|nr:hypothetical protein N0V90_001011 [Kalmusia sp. IMI 367209]
MDSTDYPLPPKTKPGEKTFQCPYCLASRDVGELIREGNKYWERHVDEDLEPYVCLFPECAEALVFFPERAVWRSHMENVHARNWTQKVHNITWYCDIDHGPPEQFETRLQWSEHMKNPSSHPKRKLPTPSETQLEALSIRKQQIALREPYVCPLCEQIPEKIRSLVEKGKGNSKDMHEYLINHIAKHIKSLSLVSLPCLDGTSAPLDTEENSVRMNDSFRRLMKDGSVPQPPSGIELLDNTSDEVAGLDIDFEDWKLDNFYDVTETGENHWETYLQYKSDFQEYMEYSMEDDEVLQLYWRASLQSHLRTSSEPSTPPPKPRKPKGLRHMIEAEMVHPNNIALRFLPDSSLREVISEQSVTEALERHQHLESKVSELVEFVCSSAPRLFATLVWTDSDELIDQFYQHQFGDYRLPIHVSITENDDSPVDVYTLTQGAVEHITQQPFNSEPWTERMMKIICEYQWLFMSPVFRENRAVYRFDERCRLPFVSDPRMEIESPFNVIQERCIHRSHLRATPDNPEEHPSVAVKYLKRGYWSAEEYADIVRAEINMLELLRKLDHDHLIKAIAHYTKGKDTYTIFPWARNNLQDLWRTDPPTLDPLHLKWFFAQLCGLSGAIAKLHQSNIRHGNLKPENILCFVDALGFGTGREGLYNLVISDVRITDMHEMRTEIHMEETYYKSRATMYQPPEAGFNLNAPRSRLYDVWSLGCIYLEFIVWLLYGAKELRNFRNEDDWNLVLGFYDLKRLRDSPKMTAQLSNRVQRYIDRIKHDKRCSPNTALRDLLELIVDSLLVVEIGGDGSGSRGRATSSELVDAIEKIYRDMENHEVRL